MAVLLPAGLAWLTMLATMSGTLQVFLPGWVRARGLAIHQMVFSGLFNFGRAPSDSSLTIGGSAGCSATVLVAGSCPGS